MDLENLNFQNFKNKHHQRWVKEYLTNCKEQNKSPHTIQSYFRDLERFILWFEYNSNANLNLTNSKTIDLYQKTLSGHETKSALPFQFFHHLILRFKFWRYKKNQFLKYKNYRPLSPNSRKRHLSSLKNFFEYLKQVNEDQNSLFRTNPIKTKIHKIKVKDQDILHTVYLNKADWRLLDDNIYRPDDRLIIHLLYYGGLRLSELTKMTLANFGKTKYTLTIKRKGGKIHQFYPQKPGLIWECLEKYLNTHNISETGPLFPNKNHLFYSTKAIYNRIMKFFIKAQCQQPGLTPHSFRKACATNLYQETKDLLLVRDYLNHSDAKVTQTYIDEKALFAHRNIH